MVPHHSPHIVSVCHIKQAPYCHYSHYSVYPHFHCQDVLMVDNISWPIPKETGFRVSATVFFFFFFKSYWRFFHIETLKLYFLKTGPRVSKLIMFGVCIEFASFMRMLYVFSAFRVFLWQQHSATYRPGIRTTGLRVIFSGMCTQTFLEAIPYLWETFQECKRLFRESSVS